MAGSGSGRVPPAGGVSRREFVGTAAAAAGAPLLLPSRLFGKDAPSNRIRVGQIGCGRIARGHDMTGVFESGLADIVAVCDVDAKRAAAGKELVEKLYRDAGRTAPAVGVHADYRELLTLVDAVVISTPDHWHAEPALAAARAGKDIYLQKPFTMTHAEGVLLHDALARHETVFQIGSQQRSSEQFRRACELVRSGRVGRLQRIEIGLPIDPTRPDDPEQPVPANLDYDRWLGCTPRVHYTEQRVHPQQGYDRPGWLRNESYCLGMITGWGSHHFDTAHWAMDLDHATSGPLRAEGRGEFPANTIWNVHGAYELELVYSGDVRVRVSDKLPNGLRFIGDEGWIWVTRQGQTTSSDPANPGATMPPLDASDKKLLDPAGVKVELPRSEEHHRNWLECVRSRQTPIAPAAAAHAANSACIVGWIAMKLGRPLVWDATAGRFTNDDAANALLSRPERAPYGASRVAGA